TRTVEIFGSPTYMSPEQCRGDRVDARSDIYSLGCLMYEVLFGRTPFRDDNPVKTLLAHMYDQPPRAKFLVNKERTPEALAAVINTCLEKQPGRRYSSMTELGADLELFRQNKQPRTMTRIDAKKLKRKAAFTAAKYSPVLVILLAVWMVFASRVDIPWAMSLTKLKQATTAESDPHASASSKIKAAQERKHWAETLLTQADQYNRPMALWYLEGMESDQGHGAEALKYAQEAAAQLEQSGRPGSALRVNQDIFTLLLKQNKPQEAAKVADHMVDLYAHSAEPEKGMRLIGWFYLPPLAWSGSLNYVLSTMGIYDRPAAEAFALKLATAAENKGDITTAGTFKAHYARLLLERGNQHDAVAAFDSAYAYSQSNNNFDLDAWKRLGCECLISKDLGRAEKAFAALSGDWTCKIGLASVHKMM
ncbi:MAG: serine/threonine protein kinase, partial [Terriglobales bacterium]